MVQVTEVPYKFISLLLLPICRAAAQAPRSKSTTIITSMNKREIVYDSIMAVQGLKRLKSYVSFVLFIFGFVPLQVILFLYLLCCCYSSCTTNL